MKLHSDFTEFEKKVMELILSSLITDPPPQKIQVTKENREGSFCVTFTAVPQWISEEMRQKIKKLQEDQEVVVYVDNALREKTFMKENLKRGDPDTAALWRDISLEKRDVILKALGLWETYKKLMKKRN